MGHLAALIRSHLIGDQPSGLMREHLTETMDPSPKTKGQRPYPRQWNLELVGAGKLPKIVNTAAHCFSQTFFKKNITSNLPGVMEVLLFTGYHCLFLNGSFWTDLASWEVCIVKNCDGGLENVPWGCRPKAAFLSLRSQFFTIQTDPKPVNNMFIIFLC